MMMMKRRRWQKKFVNLFDYNRANFIPQLVCPMSFPPVESLLCSQRLAWLVVLSNRLKSLELVKKLAVERCSSLALILAIWTDINLSQALLALARVRVQCPFIWWQLEHREGDKRAG